MPTTLLLATSLLASCFVGSVIPFINTELIILGVAAAAPKRMAVLLIVAATVAHMAGKVVVYYVATGLLHIPPRPWTARLRAVIARNAERVGKHSSLSRAALFISAATGLPPFYAATIASGTARMRLRDFLCIGTAGRLIRFGGIAAVSRWLLPAVAAFVLSATASVGSAQTPDSVRRDTAHAPAMKELCWTVPDVARCKTTLVTSIGYERAIASNAMEWTYPNYPAGHLFKSQFRSRSFVLDLTLLNRLSPRLAAGPSIKYVCCDSHITRFGMQARSSFAGNYAQEFFGGLAIGRAGTDRWNSSHPNANFGWSLQYGIGYPRIGVVGVTYDDMPWPSIQSSNVRVVHKPSRARAATVFIRPGPVPSLAEAGAFTILFGIFLAQFGAGID